MIGLEAGQSAFGDVLAWFKNMLEWPLADIVMESKTLSDKQKKALREEFDAHFINRITKAAESISMEESIPVALDWINGRRTPDANQNLKGAITNLNLGASAPHLFLSLIIQFVLDPKPL